MPQEVNTSNKTWVTKHESDNNDALLKLILFFSILEIKKPKAGDKKNKKEKGMTQTSVNRNAFNIT